MSVGCKDDLGACVVNLFRQMAEDWVGCGREEGVLLSRPFRASARSSACLATKLSFSTRVGSSERSLVAKQSSTASRYWKQRKRIQQSCVVTCVNASASFPASSSSRASSTKLTKDQMRLHQDPLTCKPSPVHWSQVPAVPLM